MTETVLLGQILRFTGDPFKGDPVDATRIESAGAVVIDHGKIVQTGPAADMQAQYPNATVINHGDDLLLAGFVDAHVHYPQTRIIASWGKRLIDWLNSYTFPEEIRLADPAYARAIASDYLDLALAHGTTTVCSFCTSAPTSVTAFFEAAASRNMAVVAGKTCMDRNAPDALTDTPQRAYDESKTLLDRWHGAGRARYAITPRFSPTSSREQLEALGALWAERPECLMQTHLSEQVDEVAWVRTLFPQAHDYLDTYEHAGLLGQRGLYGHAIHLAPREIDRLSEVGAALVHCPTSNTFIGSGLFEMAKLKARHISVGLATDTGGGSSFSMLRTMAAAYEIGQLCGTPLHAAQLLYLATEGSARALHMHHDVGTLAEGSAADICVLDLRSTPAISQRAHRAQGFWDAVFPTLMMGDDRAVRQVYIAGRAVL
ncbi:guanine deaminase [Nereida sp. MMG025]|uniref:guanine deaminase n=1 Tax=Nereida sp. MMG025 TaxID=2909981 RepID=UPI001F01C021|nr:guanine deaminase [Nereida sp. MMG025]MCF6443939.1 guanine deaminase [Nereida sp. MMG025]